MNARRWGALAAFAALLGVGVHVRAARIRAAPRDVQPVAVVVPDSDPAAIARGRHLFEVRYGCADCHGADLAGGRRQDLWPILTLVPPNISPGGVTAGFAPEDWDRIVRHGLLSDGRAALMPVMESHRMSDQELGDLIAYARSAPPAAVVQDPSSLRLVGEILLTAGALPLSADEIDQRPDRLAAPPTEPVALGDHLAHTCRGCHGPDLRGGAIPGAPPTWPRAPDLRALDGWSRADFDRALRGGVRPDGTRLDPVMPWRVAAGMTDAEVDALWAFLQATDR